MKRISKENRKFSNFSFSKEKKIKNKENFDLKEQYKKSWSYILESKYFIFSIVIIFLLVALIGYFIKAPDFLSEAIINYLKEIETMTHGFSQADWMGFIFWNNLVSSFLGLILGLIFGIYSFIGAVANGYLLGFVANLAVSEQGISSLWRLLPHGIFELPAIFISLGMGLKLGTFLFQKKKLISFKYYLLNSLRVFFYIIMPLLIIAAVIEGSLIAFFS